MLGIGKNVKTSQFIATRAFEGRNRATSFDDVRLGIRLVEEKISCTF